MDASRMKNIVILRNLPSNLIEEAIVVVKENKKVPKLDYINSIKDGGEVFSSKSGRNKNEKKLMKTEDIKAFEKANQEDRDYVVKEAEIVVSNYITKVEQSDKKKSISTYKIEKKYRNMKVINILLALFSILCIGINLIK